VIYFRSPGKCSFLFKENKLLLLIPCTNYLNTVLRPVCGFHVLMSYIILCLPVMEMCRNMGASFYQLKEKTLYLLMGFIRSKLVP